MNISIVYDSVYGNTAKVAGAIGEELERDNTVRLLTVQEAQTADFTGADLLIVGSPTRGFRPTPGISEFIEGLDKCPAAVAVFDTRIDLETVNPQPLRWVIDVGGYATSRMTSAVERHGLQLRGQPAAFLVSGTEGPLKDGELDRARSWSRGLLEAPASHDATGDSSGR